eukprot:scaffold131_cov381-Pinguiococcus_pyrenoidosus.AAC.5
MCRVHPEALPTGHLGRTLVLLVAIADSTLPDRDGSNTAKKHKTNPRPKQELPGRRPEKKKRGIKRPQRRRNRTSEPFDPTGFEVLPLDHQRSPLQKRRKAQPGYIDEAGEAEEPPVSRTWSHSKILRRSATNARFSRSAAAGLAPPRLHGNGGAAEVPGREEAPENGGFGWPGLLFDSPSSAASTGRSGDCRTIPAWSSLVERGLTGAQAQAITRPLPEVTVDALQRNEKTLVDLFEERTGGSLVRCAA